MKVVCFGECMLEVKIEEYPRARVSYGGDTYNCAYYLALLGINAYFMTSIGDDKPSKRLLRQWQLDGVNIDFVQVLAQKKLGLYCIETDASGERSFSYWRENSAPSYFFLECDISRLLKKFNSSDWFYFSLISLAILQGRSRPRFIEFLKQLRELGVKLAFDNNYRPALWSSRELACQYLDQVLPLIDIYLPSVEDEMAIRAEGESAALARLSALNIAEVVIKNGAADCHLYTRASHYHYPFEKVAVIDSTAAGDSFNAGYIGARLDNKSPRVAIKSACQLAAQVIMHPGAIIDGEKLSMG